MMIIKCYISLLKLGLLKTELRNVYLGKPGRSPGNQEIAPKWRNKEAFPLLACSVSCSEVVTTWKTEGETFCWRDGGILLVGGLVFSFFLFLFLVAWVVFPLSVKLDCVWLLKTSCNSSCNPKLTWVSLEFRFWLFKVLYVWDS